MDYIMQGMCPHSIAYGQCQQTQRELKSKANGQMNGSLLLLFSSFASSTSTLAIYSSPRGRTDGRTTKVVHNYLNHLQYLSISLGKHAIELEGTLNGEEIAIQVQELDGILANGRERGRVGWYSEWVSGWLAGSGCGSAQFALIKVQNCTTIGIES